MKRSAPYVIVSTFLFLTASGRLCGQSPTGNMQAVAAVDAPKSSVALKKTPDGLLVVTSRVDMVLIPVSVTDKQGRSVANLNKNNFRIFEDNRPQGLQNVSLEDAPTSIGIVVDTSASMESKLPRALLAMHELMANANPEDEFFLIPFSDQPGVPVGFTSSARTLEDALLATQASGYTALLDALSLAVAKMRDAKYSRRALVVISDGGDNHSRETASHLMQSVEESDVLIYAIGLYDESLQSIEEVLGPELLKKMSNRSGGATFDARDRHEISDAVRRIMSQVRFRYVLSYYPDQKPHDGKWHTIKVKLKVSRRPPLRVHAKAGYYALAR